MFDVKVCSSYPKRDVEHLRICEIEGFCVSTAVKARDFGRHSGCTPELDVGKGVYSRVEVEFSEGEQVGYEQKRAMKADLFVVKLNDARGLDRLIKLLPDMVTFNYVDQPLAFKPGLIRTAVKENIFFEIPLREGLYRGGVMWMRNVRRLLAITNGRNTVVSSGATCSTEIKSPRDIAKMLEMFGIRRKRAEDMLENPRRLLRSCAMRRHCHKGMIVHSGDEGVLKRDFILSEYRK